ncbi:hypothetical protein Bca4012_028456 [Brassica carinata]
MFKALSPLSSSSFSSTLPLPPMTSDGRSMDFLRLSINVSNRGGFKAVSENVAWDEEQSSNGFLSKTKKLEKFDSGSNKDRSSNGKRKRECFVETLKWLNEAAKDPYDTSIGSLPDRSKWDSYGSEEPWKQLLLFRDSRTNTISPCRNIWNSAGPSYNLRERLSNQFNERKAGKDGSDLKDESCGLLGSEFQAEVPDWSVITSESDSKCFDTLIWPLNIKQNNNNLPIERDPIGNSNSDKMLTMLVSAMGECALSIVREPEPQYFDEDFLHDL